ncbi:hypothetical protein RR48_08303 [Papilio machaon]|uniref:Uncharacterized protein n=1 Tax=Papilio machaon TaxID=76193 RepID=A0A194R6S3_PAPMA|nr:hypothetical protein RR48_08303 [Papilio machaon]
MHHRPELNLRLELSLNLDNAELDNWLGKFDEELDYRFDHDIPLQRSISLDGGIEIFNYLNTLGSDWSGASEWSLNSNDSDRMLEQYRSFEDVPASQYKMISRRASLAMGNEVNNMALHALRSYKGVEMEKGRLSPQVKKLQKTFSFKSFFDEVKESEKSFNEGEIEDDEMLEMRAPLIRSVSYESRTAKTDDRDEGSGNMLRQRRMGTIHNVWYEETQKSRTLRKKVLMKRCTSHIQFKSSERLGKSIDDIRCGSVENVANLKPVPFIRFKDRYKDIDRISTFNIQKHKSDINFITIPTIVVTDTDSLVKDDYKIDTLTDMHHDNSIESVANQVNIDTSDAVEEKESICDCRICREDDEDYSKSFLSRKLNKLFIKIVSLIEFGKKLTYWDDNNNISEGEMYSCIMHVLKLMFGLWLRHFDHNPQVLST